MTTVLHLGERLILVLADRVDPSRSGRFVGCFLM
jgi:hypothetical protein